jgi:hypothetical protein
MWTAVSHYKTIFADTNPMTKDEIVATGPGRMKLWLARTCRFFEVPVRSNDIAVSNVAQVGRKK